MDRSVRSRTSSTSSVRSPVGSSTPAPTPIGQVTPAPARHTLRNRNSDYHVPFPFLQYITFFGSLKTKICFAN